MSKQSLEKLIDLIGGQVALADALSTPKRPIKQAYVWKWLNTTIDGIPEKHVINASKAVNYEITPHELRPDIYPHHHDGLPAHLRLPEAKNKQSASSVNTAQVPLI